ncbi:MAG: 3-deoxy-D-manno-octulosonic acid transferase [Geobacteraceae bacterium]|nr:3-deoxy-D-manno-octulosonic acid transferase [Geobacteraceae bacterium]
MAFYIVYEILLLLFSPLILCWYLCRALKRGRPPALAERFGFLSARELSEISGHDTIWVHAVSVGETMAVKTLLKELRKKYPQSKIVLSNVTETGRKIALQLPEIDLCIYFPFDFRLAVRKILKSIKPDLVVIAETELWPNFIRETARRRIPLVLVNGRISDRSFVRYKKLEWVFRDVLGFFSALCMQTEEDGRRIKSLGAVPERVHVAGNLKYDVPVKCLDSREVGALRKEYHVPPSATVFTAGSTHQGEEEPVLGAYNELLKENSNLFLVLAPRHPERAAKVVELLQTAGMKYLLRSKLDCNTPVMGSGEVLLLDTVGELAKMYSFSDVVFVGGSLVPVGGHNLLEPASLGVPVLFGPYMNNFKEIRSLVLKNGGGIEVADQASLAGSLRELLNDVRKRNEMGMNGADVLRRNSGSTERHMEIISSFL